MTERLMDTFTSKVGKAEIAVLMPIHNEAKTIEKSVTEFYNVKPQNATGTCLKRGWKHRQYRKHN